MSKTVAGVDKKSNPQQRIVAMDEKRWFLWIGCSGVVNSGYNQGGISPEETLWSRQFFGESSLLQQLDCLHG